MKLDKVVDHGFAIVVLTRRYHYVGAVQTGTAEDGQQWLVIKGCKNIRQWGTTRGLGQLVDGPTASTVLDTVGEVRAPMVAVISVIPCNVAKWNKAA